MSGMAEVLTKMARALYEDGAYCGDCEYDGYDQCATCRRVCLSYAEALTAAGFGYMAEAKAQALEEAADQRAARSETLLATMKNMVAAREYGHDDILRYGAYAAEANTTATWLRACADTVRGER